ncbi:tRNA (adenosine(37)-N6)-threonylcarbamoyltransferase complex transferase subunit TsaD [Buchnera aphidicola (Ceratovacuna keduensis)]|uniref:tRNA (adenosine(37)-N6)-threonylcarbamoyltransferase complex transferase subunit TsaD n=1 Tax=Buchnera aphidicola TaxID=9 RepID=UPI0031B86125
MKILGIETSCDDTSIALYDDKIGLIFCFTISQSNIHSKYGGVVPEIAARLHLKNIFILLNKLIKNKKISKKNVNAISCTIGPGLSGSLLVGTSVANSLSYLWKVPIIFVNHMESHLFSYMLNKKYFDVPKFPILSLLVSGGHTQIVLARSLGKYEILGDCLDDPAGEVIDKIANMLGIKYPGGRKLSELAKFGKSNIFNFPKPMLYSNNFNFSFSGLKTHVSRIILNNNYIIDDMFKFNIAKELEKTIVEILVKKSFNALKFTKLKTLVVSGGVSANNTLRKNIRNMSKKIKNCFVHFTNNKFCTDNAAMVAYLGMLYFKNGMYSSPKIFFFPKLSISNNIYF